MDKLQQLLDSSAAHHDHLCPRQVLGVKMGVYAAELLGLDYPQTDKRLFTFVETDGCFADGISAATGCTLGHRTLRLMDLGKVAAVFVDTKTQQALRLRPCLNVRELAKQCNIAARSRWHTQLAAYQQLDLSVLFDVQEIQLNLAMEAIISRAGVRVNCAECGEEIINEREVYQDGQCLCQTCAGNGYYSLLVPTLAYMD